MTFKSLSNRLANLLVEDNKKNWPAIAAIFIIILFPVIFLAGLTFFRARQQLECKVEDNRIGIPTEMLPFIFDKFRQVDSSDTRSYDGVGLGPYIAKEFARLLGGDINVQSEPERGTTFTVTLPC